MGFAVSGRVDAVDQGTVAVVVSAFGAKPNLGDAALRELHFHPFGAFSPAFATFHGPIHSNPVFD